LYGLSFKRARSYCKTGEINAGLKLARKAVELKPDNASYLDTLANLLFETGEVETAGNLIRKAISISPDDAEIRNSYDRIVDE